jgi:hypothetical protein
MAKSTPADIVVSYDDANGALQDISQYVQTLGGIEIENLIEETHTFGDSMEESTPVGIGRWAQVEIGGLYDDANGGPNDLFNAQLPTNPNSATRTLKIEWGNNHNTSVETILIKYTRQPDRSALTKFSATLQPVGSPTETP